MQALTDYSLAFDVVGEHAESIARADESAIDSAFIDLKRNAARKAQRAELWQSLLDSGNGPAKNPAHERLIEMLAGLDAEDVIADDLESVQAFRRQLAAIVSVAFDDVLIDAATREVRP